VPRVRARERVGELTPDIQNAWTQRRQRSEQTWGSWGFEVHGLMEISVEHKAQYRWTARYLVLVCMVAMGLMGQSNYHHANRWRY
jgi:hypothetical protein